MADRWLMLPVRLGLGHGRIKSLLYRAWLRRNGPRPVDITYRGVRFRLHPKDNSIEWKMLFSSRLREGRELDFMKAGTQRGVFVDIGANMGYYTLMAAMAGFDCVLAFEPNPVVFPRLAFNVQINGLEERIRLHAIACGDREGEVCLEAGENGDLGGVHVSEKGIPEGTDCIRVTMRPLSDVLDDEGIETISVLKIDVEGYEDRVLMPFFETEVSSRWPGKVIIEHTSREGWAHDVVGVMRSHGYREVGRTRGNLLLMR